MEGGHEVGTEATPNTSAWNKFKPHKNTSKLHSIINSVSGKKWGTTGVGVLLAFVLTFDLIGMASVILKELPFCISGHSQETLAHFPSSSLNNLRARLGRHQSLVLTRYLKKCYIDSFNVCRSCLSIVSNHVKGGQK